MNKSSSVTCRTWDRVTTLFLNEEYDRRVSGLRRVYVCWRLNGEKEFSSSRSCFCSRVKESCVTAAQDCSELPPKMQRLQTQYLFIHCYDNGENSWAIAKITIGNNNNSNRHFDQRRYLTVYTETHTLLRVNNLLYFNIDLRQYIDRNFCTVNGQKLLLAIIILLATAFFEPSTLINVAGADQIIYHQQESQKSIKPISNFLSNYGYA